MGHFRLGNLPRTRRWKQVIALIGEGADAPEVAAATLEASKQSLKYASNDPGFVSSLLLLTEITQAARKADFVSAVRKAGLSVSDEPTLSELTSQLSTAIDRAMPNNRGRTDFGEMAGLAAAESLVRLCTEKTRSLFGTSTKQLQTAVKDLSTNKGFSMLAREYFSRLTYRYLSYFLSREFSNHVGPNGRFANAARHTEYLQALEQHTREATRVIQEFAGGWYGKAQFEGGIDRKKVSGFASYALEKITSELAKGGEPNDS